MAEGWILGGNEQAIWLTKGECRVTFDIVVQTRKGRVYAMYFERDEIMPNCPEMVNAMADCKLTKKAPTMTIMEAHCKFGHANEDATRAAAKEMGIQIVWGGMKTCEACTVAKAKQKNVMQESKHVPASSDGRRMFLDLARVKKQAKEDKDITQPYWRIVVDERTNLKFSAFALCEEERHGRADV